MRFRRQICVRDATYPTSPIHPSNIPNAGSNSASSIVSGGVRVIAIAHDHVIWQNT